MIKQQNIKSQIQEKGKAKRKGYVKLSFSIIFFAIYFAILVPHLLATITFSHSQPNVEQPVNFTVTHVDGIYPPSVQWSFGDGTSAMGLTTVTKRYYRTGTFVVSVKYQTYKQAQVTEQVTINVVERRRISFTPLYPAAGRLITFRAENFLSTKILWNFGDGTPPQLGSVVITHTFSKVGRYTVKASDWAGESIVPISTIINITEEKGPRSAFQIYFLQLRFEDGKAYKVVARNETLVAYADIKYEGTGILQGYWLVDGVPFKPISMVLPFARQKVISSGEIPGLPTQFPGRHEVSLRIIHPQTEYIIPVITYFVSLERKAPEPKKEGNAIVDFEIFEPDGKQIEYLILKGKINLNNVNFLPYALLRVYIGNELIDQQILRNYKPGEEREIITSIYNSSLEQKKLHLLIYDISKKSPELVFLKRFNINPAK